MNVLVTGATGGLGRNLVEALLREGCTVWAMGRRPNVGAALEMQGASFLCGDITAEHCFDALSAVPDIVVHCAALSSPWGAWNDFYETNVRGTERVATWALRHGVQRFVHISTPALYLSGEDRFDVREDDALPRRWANWYADTKYQAEQVIARLYEEGLRAVVVRPRAIFGPFDAVLVPRLMRILEKGWFPLVDGGRSLTDVIYVDDVVGAIQRILQADARVIGKTYNISSGTPVSFRELIAKITDSFSLRVRPISVPYPAMLGFAGLLEGMWRRLSLPNEPMLTRYAVQLLGRSLTLDISAARRDFGYAPQVSLDEGLRRYCRWLSMNPGG